MEPSITVRAKESDVALVKEITGSTSKFIEEKSGKPVSIEVDEKSFLPANM